MSGYDGVKFRSKPISLEVPTDPRIRELIKVGRLMWSLGATPPYEGAPQDLDALLDWRQIFAELRSALRPGYQEENEGDGTFGNLSFRVYPGTPSPKNIITCSGTNLGGVVGNRDFATGEKIGTLWTPEGTRPDDVELANPDHITEVSLEDIGKTVDPEDLFVFYHGIQIPSSEEILHLELYKRRPDINAIVHGHLYELMFFAQYFGFPDTAQEEEYGTLALVRRVLDIVDDENNFIHMKDHGFIAMGETIEEASLLAAVGYRQCYDLIAKTLLKYIIRPAEQLVIPDPVKEYARSVADGS